MREGEADIVQALGQAALAERVDIEAKHLVAGAQFLVRQIDRYGKPGAGGVHQHGDFGFRQGDRQQAVLAGVAGEDVAEARRDHRPHAGIGQRIDRALTRRSAAEIGARDQDRRVAFGAEREGGIGGADVVKQEIIVAGRAGFAQEAGRDDLVGVDIGLRQHRGRAGHDGDLGHGWASWRGSTSAPAIAAAAAIAGDIRWVRAPWPWRPAKLRFDVAAQRAPGAT